MKWREGVEGVGSWQGRMIKKLFVGRLINLHRDINIFLIQGLYCCNNTKQMYITIGGQCVKWSGGSWQDRAVENLCVGSQLHLNWDIDVASGDNVILTEWFFSVSLFVIKNNKLKTHHKITVI